MAPPITKPPAAKTGYDKWLDTVSAAASDPAWSEYDDQIKVLVLEFNQRLAKPGLVGPNLDWRLIKAMVWVESGGPTNAAWKTRPLQIGNPGDPGLSALLGHNDGGELILTATQRTTIQAGASTPAANLLAGTAYLLMRAAISNFQSVASTTDPRTYEVTVKPGDSLDRIARTNGTTIQMLQSMNPTAAGIIRPGQVLKYRKAAIQRVITGWHLITTTFAAQKYNVGDPKYKDKLDHCLKLMSAP